MNKWPVFICGLLFIFKGYSALEYNRQRLNTDFLLHEGGAQTTGTKRDYVNSDTFGQSPNSNQFPALGPQVTPKSTSTSHQTNQPATPKTTTTTASVNPGPQRNPQSSTGKRDYVAPQFPTLKPVQSNQQATPKPTTASVNSGPPRSPQSSSSNRDYIAPQFPALKPVQNNHPTQNNQQSSQATGNKVKDLVNYYDNKTPNQGSPSYSSILQGPTNKNTISSSTKFTQSIPTTSPIQPTKPMSFSSIVTGQNKPTTSGTRTVTTAKPIRAPSSPGSRPGTPVLPSSIVNNNRPATSNSTNAVTDAELQVLSEELLRKDTNNAARYITVNYQEKTTSQSTEDKAQQPLLTISPEVWNIPTIQKFVPLLDNYELDSLVNEHVTPQERIEENNFMDAVMSTTVMRHLMNFLKNKGLVSLDPKQQRDFVKQLWFTLYSRGKGKLGSSGFEHTFLSEIKNGGVQGLHNWIYFSKEEAANRVNYLGYMKYVELNDKGVLLKFHFNQQGLDKPVNGMFIGTSPELELALYTLCFITRVDNDCNLKLGNKDVNIVTYNYRYRSKNLVGTAFPQI
ncbi:unnamed protein product [Arctia plantaginis]|uniref:EndoU domain-containing protein n=1 Tax=Arctia plantaginis TaxID=874455 RepID=A0A8S1A4V3_ARCPL|nr:unnamed protein product [Arctia plantaginis]